ncbi:MAG TPA: hypothetical protein VFQ61_23970, partial [Polyangiaceae bacterium]|nr:hypothetical protein [Polyangiaceae bacterium]
MTDRRTFWRAATLLIWLAVFFVASGVGVILHLNLPQSRRVLGRLATSALNQNLQGRFEVGEIEQIGPQNLIVNGFSAHDPQGRRVLIASRVALSVDLITLVRKLFTDTDAPLTIAIEHAQLASVEAHWYESQDGTPSLLQTFTPRPSPAAPQSSAARPVRVGVRSIALNRGYARGAPAGLPTLELEISQARGWVLATQSGAELRFDRFGAVLRGFGGADTRGVASVHVRTPGPLAVSFDGFHEAIQFGAEVRAQGGNVGIALDLPRVQPNDARALFPEYPLLEQASAQLELIGKLPELKLSARVTTTSSSFNAAGPLHLGTAPRARLEVDGTAIDLAALAPGLPRTRFDARALLDLKLGPKFELGLTGRTAPTVAFGAELPALELLANLDSEHISGHARAREPGSPVAIDFERRDAGPWKLGIEIPRLVLERNPRLASLETRGTASLRASATLDRGAAQGDFELGVKGLEHVDAAARELKLAGSFRGRVENLSRLELTSKLQARDARLLDFPFRELNVSLSGPLSQPVLKLEANDRNGSQYQASARLAPRTESGQLIGVGVSRLELVARRGRSELTGKAEQVELRRQQLKIQNLVAQGFGGSLSGSAEVTPSVVHLDARGSGLDLGSLGRFLGLPPHYVRGALAFDADCVLARDIETGTVHVRLEQASVGPLDGLTLTARAALENHRLALDADAQVASLGLGRLQAAVEVPTTVRDLRALQRDALGRIEVEVGRVDLGLLGNLLAPGTSSRLEGVVGMRAVATRSRAGALPDLELTAQSLGLRVPAELTGLKNPVEGLDVGLGLRMAGGTGDTEASVKLLDHRGLLASATASARYDVEGTLRQPQRVVQALLDTPILGKLVIEDRALAEWPAFLVPPRGPSGRARAELTWSGSPRSPDVAAKLRLAGLELTSDGNSQPLDLCLNAAWSNAAHALGSSGQLYLTERGRETCGGTRVAHYTLGATAVLNAGTEPQLDGNALLVLEAFPLTAVPSLKESGLSGLMSGRASLSRTGGAPAFSANVSLAQLGVRGTSVGDGRLEVRSGQDTVGATLEIGDARSHIQGTVLAALDHSAGFPKLKRGEPVGVRLSAQRANAALLAPLTHEVLADLGGELDAEVTAALVPGTDPANAAFSSQIGG